MKAIHEINNFMVSSSLEDLKVCCYFLANLIAASFAAIPEFVKKTLPTNDDSTSHYARFPFPYTLYSTLIEAKQEKNSVNLYAKK